jgi:hypothetical protein
VIRSVPPACARTRHAEKRAIHEPQTDGRVDLYENVHIARFGLLTAGIGAEQGQLGHMEVPREFGQRYL